MKLIKRIECPVCNFDKIQSIYKLSYRDPKIKIFLEAYYNKKLNPDLIADNNYNLLECKNCKFIFQEYIPDELFSEHLYEDLISATASLKKKEENIRNLKKKYYNEIFLIDKIFQGKKINILEFGAGWGFWSLVAKESGFNVSCLELSKKRVEYMKSKNLNVINVIEKNKPKYDFIYSDQTFEHIGDPKKTLELLNSSLNLGGYILLNFPSSFGFKRKIKNNYIPNKDEAHPLEHLNLFNRSSMNYLIRNTKLKLINFRSLNSLRPRYIYKDIKNLIYFDSVLLKKII
jgi:rubredoxin|tara:strand:- start:123 stop:986 length:864 start_codon:yes stop_codon:yes gene_type:complete